MENTPEFIKKMEAKAERLRNAAFKTTHHPESPYGYRYSGFQRRMMAAALDSGIMLFTIIPLSFLLTDVIVGPTDFNFQELAVRLQNVTDPIVQQEVTKQYLYENNRMNYMFINFIWQTFLMFLYCMFFWPRFGATPGKMLTRLKVIRLSDGQHLTYTQSFWRCIGYVTTLGLGVVWVLWDKNRQALHDKLSGSIVIAGLNFNTLIDKNVNASTESFSDE